MAAFTSKIKIVILQQGNSQSQTRTKKRLMSRQRGCHFNQLIELQDNN